MTAIETVPGQTVAVIGAGPLGRGIACASALGGYRTILEDLLPNALRKAEGEIRGRLDLGIKAGGVAAAAAEAALDRLHYAGSVEAAAREADFIIESVPDELESKLEIFTLLDKVCRPHTILASNTSCLSISEISSVTYRPAKCVGMRFVHPVQSMKSLEVVKTAATDEETVAAAVGLGRSMGMEVSVVQESIAEAPAMPTR